MTTTEGAHPKGLFRTLRRDSWYWYPALTAFVLILFGIYSIWAAVFTGIYWPEENVFDPDQGGASFHWVGQGANYQETADYLSPFFAPCLTDACHGFASGLITSPAFISPAFFILWAPLGLRLTCYYYRKAYYRAFFFDPPGCAVGEHRHKYKGETAFPFFLQNLHRYFLYVALIFPPFLFYEAFLAFRFHDVDTGVATFGIGVGSLILLVNAILLSGFTFGCHALRHVAGGRLNCYSCSYLARGQRGLWRLVTWFNKRHALWAWTSLVMVGLADLYVRGLYYGWWFDWRLI
jgi:hypothetical protein